MTKKEYHIHDNCGRPFKVTIKEKKVTIAALYENEYINFVTYRAKQIFIGISEKNTMTEFGRGYGPDFDGNSILLHIRKKQYVFIGSRIYIFNSRNKIVRYESPVGNNDVPYPYAIDEKNNIYLLIENVILTPTDDLMKYMEDKNNDPSFYYYDSGLITQDKGSIPPQQPLRNFDNIKEFYIGKSRYTMKYKPNPKTDYNRFMHFKRDEVDKYGISVVDQNGKKTQLTKQMYVDLMKKIGKELGFKSFTTIPVHDRLW